MSILQNDQKEIFRVHLDYKEHLSFVHDVLYSQNFNKQKIRRDLIKIKAGILFSIFYFIYSLITHNSLIFPIVCCLLLMVSFIIVYLAPGLQTSKRLKQFMSYAPSEYIFYHEGFQVDSTYLKYDFFDKAKSINTGIIFGNASNIKKQYSFLPIPKVALSKEDYDKLYRLLDVYFDASGRKKKNILLKH